MNKPPPTLDCAQVLEFAIVDKTVTFEQRHTLNVGGEWLGEVPHLAVCRNLDETEFMVFHCDHDWQVLGVAAGYASVEEAKKSTERAYHGISKKWAATGYTREEAVKYLELHFKDQSCSFCGRMPFQFESLAGDTVRICNHCVDSFYEIMHRPKEKT
jgi:hypothetical protein